MKWQEKSPQTLDASDNILERLVTLHTKMECSPILHNHATKHGKIAIALAIAYSITFEPHVFLQRFS